jgi:ribose 5-phosphate isomerase B
MRIAIGADHAGFALKTEITKWLDARGLAYLDVGAARCDPADDYPDYAAAVAGTVVSGQADLGVMVCGTGVGSCMAANKVPGGRAVVCSDVYSARQSRLHNDANVLCLGQRVVGVGLALELVAAWLGEGFSGELRHRRRLDKVMALERRGREEA